MPNALVSYLSCSEMRRQVPPDRYRRNIDAERGTAMTETAGTHPRGLLLTGTPEVPGQLPVFFGFLAQGRRGEPWKGIGRSPIR
jgi:hypothetical protein